MKLPQCWFRRFKPSGHRVLHLSIKNASFAFQRAVFLDGCYSKGNETYILQVYIRLIHLELQP